MSKRCKVNSKTVLSGFAITLLILLTLQINASHKHYTFFFKPLTEIDTTPVLKRPVSTTRIVNASDTGKRGKDTTIVTGFTLDSVKMSKDSLNAPITYSASDSGVLIISTKQFFLYNKAHVEYQDLTLDAGTIKYDQATQTVMAYGKRDTTNNPLDKPTLVQAGSKTISDTILYNMKSGKGLMKNTFFTQDEFYGNAEVAKKVTIGGEQVIYSYRTLFTTCNLDTPHFAFKAKKMKLIAGKLAVSGPAHPEFEGVPVPIYLPFGIYPMKRGRHSGILAPQFTSNESFGLGIEGLGYYKVLNDYYDVTVRTNLYSYGGWNLYVNPKYFKRYKYNGSFNLAIQHTKALNNSPTLKNEFTTGNTFNITWSHARDNRARPGTNFSASVNAGSTKFNYYIPNNSVANFQNNLNSTIQWSKTTDKSSITIAANHSQNSVNRLVNLNLPSVNYNTVTFYPFKQKERIGSEKWFEKLGIGYQGTLQNQINFYDSAFSAKRLLDTLQWQIDHRVPLSLALPQLGPVTLSPSINYAERWIGRSVLYTWNPTTKRLDTTYSKGFYTPREVSFSLSANTRIFGTYQLGKKSNVQAIRHEIRPSLGLNYKPDLAKKYYHTVQVDTAKNTMLYSEYSVGNSGGFSSGKFGGISYGIDNLLEMKVKDKKAAGDSTLPQTKKIRLIDGFGFSGTYNLAADSTQWEWSDIAIYLRSTLFDKINITANASLDPYLTNDQGFKTHQLALTSTKRSLGRITNGSVAASASFQSKKADQKKNQTAPSEEYVSPDEQQRLLDYARNNPAEFTDFDIPWTAQTSFSLNFYRLYDGTQQKWRTEISSNISLNGDFSLSPKWKIGGNTYFDFKTKKIELLTIFITRDMHCWQMAINITPIGLSKSFTITLNPKSGVLRDLRINRARYFYNQ